MNPTPSISDSPAGPGPEPDFPVSWNTSYTIIGTPPEEPARPLAVLVLVEGGFPSRHDIVQALWNKGFNDVILLDPSSQPRDAEALCRNWPGLRILLCDRGLSTGSRINLAMRESRTRRNLVIRSTHAVLPFVEENLQELLAAPRLCTVPLFRSPRGDVLPVLHLPTLREGSFQVLSILAGKDHERTLFPQDFCGLYDKDRFLRLGAYDEYLRQPWWQKLEFGCRAWLWGEEIRCNNTLRLQCGDEPAAEDNTPNEDYLRFYLKIILPRYLGDRAELPRGAWHSWKRAAGGSWFLRRRQFRQMEDWIRRHAASYRHDFRYLVEMWNSGGLS